MSDKSKTLDNPAMSGSELLPPPCSESDFNEAVEYTKRHCCNLNARSPQYKTHCWNLAETALRQSVEISMLKLKIFNLQNSVIRCHSDDSTKTTTTTDHQ